MNIGIVGGGPAGLYFALLMKKHNPKHDIRIIEQNPADNTYGWGIVLSGKALSLLENADPESFSNLETGLRTWDDLAIVYKDERVAVGGNS